MEEVQTSKISEEEISEIKKLLNTYHDIIVKIGDNELKINQLQIEKNKLIENYHNNMDTEKILNEKLIEKYGAGNINTKDWTFDTVVKK